MQEKYTYSLQDLQRYIVLKQQILGKDIKEIEVSKEFLIWYESQLKEVAKNLNLPITKNFKEPKYLNIKLIAK